MGGDLNSLERGQLAVMRVHAAIGALCLLAGGLAIETVFASAFDRFPTGGLMALLVVLLIYPTLVVPGRRYRAWGYAMGSDELVIASGIWTRVETIVPLPRVQHIDIAQGPIERHFGVCRLVLHTAGTAHSRVVLPGLARATAERIRDEVRARIRDDAL